MNRGCIVAVITIMAAAILVPLFFVGVVGIAIGIVIAVLVYIKRRSKVLRPIAFSIGVLIVLYGVFGLWLTIADDVMRLVS